MVEVEIDKAEYLDDFQESEAGLSKAYGPSYVVHIFPATPGPQVLSIFQATAVKAPSLCKPDSEEPIFTSLFVDSIKDIDKELGNCIWVLPWKGGNEAIEDKLFSSENSAVIVYGTEETVEKVKVKSKGKVVEYPRRIGFEVIDADENEFEEISEKVARDIAFYDQQACFSPHVIYVIGGKEKAKKFAKKLAKSLEKVEIPRSKLSTDTKAVISMYKSTCSLMKISGFPIEIYSGNEYVVVYNANPEFETSCLYRVATVKPIESIEELPLLLKNYKGHLQTVGVWLTDEDKKKIADMLQDYGVSRITDVGKVAKPSIFWHHDGNYNIAQLIKWVDIEKETEEKTG
jgi:hypothetical protein